jgi:hypothetical protein
VIRFDPVPYGWMRIVRADVGAPQRLRHVRQYIPPGEGRAEARKGPRRLRPCQFLPHPLGGLQGHAPGLPNERRWCSARYGVEACDRCDPPMPILDCYDTDPARTHPAARRGPERLPGAARSGVALGLSPAGRHPGPACPRWRGRSADLALHLEWANATPERSVEVPTDGGSSCGHNGSVTGEAGAVYRAWPAATAGPPEARPVGTPVEDRRESHPGDSS